MNQNNIKTEKDINNDKMNNLLKADINFTNLLKGKKNDFLSLKGKINELIEIEKIEADNNGNKYYYPMIFNIINENIYGKLIEILEIKDSNTLSKPEDIMATFNHGQLAFKGNNDGFCGNNMSLLYLYSAVNNQESETIDYTPEVVLDFKNKDNLFM